MEVFMHNVPAQLSDQGLMKEMEPIMKRLGILDFLCDKPKRKSIGFLVFYRPEDGERFLVLHGQEEIPGTMNARGKQRLRSKLKIMGADVFCSRSKKAPSKFAIQNLQHMAEQRVKDTLHKYEDNQHISFRLLGFSCGYTMFQGEHFGYVPEVQWSDTGLMKFMKRAIIVKLETSKHHIRIPLSTVIELIWSRDGILTLTLFTVPYFFTHKGSDPLTVAFQMLQLFSSKYHATPPSRSRMCSLSTAHADVAGQCLVYQFRVPYVDLMKDIHDLKEWEIPILRYDILPINAPPRGAFQVQLKALMDELATCTRNNSLPFGILFQLQALAYNAYLLPRTVQSLTQELVKSYKEDAAAQRRPISVLALKKLFDLIDWPSPHSNPTDYEVGALMAAVKQNQKDVLQDLAVSGDMLGPSENLTPIHKVMVTPTRVTLHGPELEPRNRILRRFPKHHDFFIRVQFCDENGQDLHFNSRVRYDDVFARFKHVLTHGIQIAGRTYSFLGWSHSSLRSHAVWFSSPFVDESGQFQTHFSIIKALGDFSKIQSPARCAARIGQAFTDTPYAISLSEYDINVSEIADVTSNDGKRVFSDGVGTLSWDVAESIWHHIPEKKGFPTCFQVRLGGAKGMLAVDGRLSGSQVNIRPSMIKFHGDMKDLEICDMAAKPMGLVLNRQMIKILEDMGTPDEWFITLQDAALTKLRSVTASAHNSEVFIKKQAVGDSIGLYRLFRHCHLRDLDYRKEPFIRSVVEAVVLKELRLIKHKARIPVFKGITLFGVMDETGLLEADQVYVTYEPIEGRHAPPPNAGTVLVTRSPALHDGDIQYAQNVIPPDNHPLAELTNCIVFSSKGYRDLPSQLSGGDLDGDIFNIIWDTDAYPVRTFAPAAYPRVSPVDIGRPVERDDMAQFFLDFMKTDHLGMIATRHMIMADQEEEGTSHPVCRQLAQLHSTAVDFSKTGIPVQLGDIPKGNPFRPDFMAPGPVARIHNKSEIELEDYVIQAAYDEDNDLEPLRRYYRSEKILGKLYRGVDERHIWQNDIQSKVQPNEDEFWDEFLWSTLERCNKLGDLSWERWLDEARHIRLRYEEAVFSARNNYSEHPIEPLSELEVFIGSVLNKGGVQTRRQRDQSNKLADEFDRISTWIVGQMREGRTSESPITSLSDQLKPLELCLACIHVGGESDKDPARRRREVYGEIKSFRVVAACALLFELDLFEKGKKRKF
ncbi:rna-dependent rna polymerase [Aspergillus eucalypticola CBS 122712]|uniref:RNA-dependent RNA polymerase n=1 Tax=Aspergillus eucalypticola (strain CBS 122712 / IBT 29274) TaxID=1448314 RepID=A0A317W7N5_ASPEC|nr:rna-dependent rna polymerase [Aspergillus eucalypticola CBS 122712]PWY81018.1 rna-dependent rna polymerase [Aspergillus eucalypticola CBS 122712]